MQRQRAGTPVDVRPVALQQPPGQLDVVQADALLQQVVPGFVVDRQDVLVLQGGGARARRRGLGCRRMYFLSPELLMVVLDVE